MNAQYEMVNMQFQNLKTQFEFFGKQLQNSVMNSNFELLMNGIEVLNIGMQIMKINFENNNMNIQMQNTILQVQNLGLQLQNIGTKFQNYGTNNLNVNKNIVQSKNVTFDLNGEKITLNFPFGTTMEKVLETYLFSNPRIERKKVIGFIFNAQKINPKDKTNVEDFFGKRENPIIQAVDMGQLIG